MKTKDQLIRALHKKEAIIAIIGLGYIGLPILLRYAEAGYKVIGYDVNRNKIDKLNSAQSYIMSVSAERIAQAQANFYATCDISKINEADAIILCLPTPLNKHREPDLSFVQTAVKSILPYLHAGQVLSLESTTYPGTTEEEVKPYIESCGLKIGEELFLVYSPEREDPGNREHNLETIPKICSGVTANCLEVGCALYSRIINKVVPVSTTKTAEMTKLLENVHRAVNIGLINELKILADKMGIDIYEVIRANLPLLLL